MKLETPYSKTEESIFKFERFGRKTRLLRAVAWVCRFIFNLKQSANKLKLNEGILTAEELEESERVIIRVVQSEVFAAELKYLTERNRGQQNRLIISKNLICFLMKIIC